ncbi:MAG TPA: HlyD family efflux transporter periplasmic adaptor subunit [Bacteroidales bacterium]|nr:HlyD family efflux transporter periplasmic adaptor subunit [Bacteroidales bacterium]HQG37250.1 HlyD family efflux transporter periplasmic adaptor subunit [Bacteroidales bacterium]HQG53834.1 HlyD family efflux transporter periplasmic adaptor subunit [Bacteroidales bacterium]
MGCQTDKTYMPELNKQEIRSPEMQEVMSGIPGSIIRWGLFIFFGIVIIFIAGSYFIKNPEIVTVPVVITTQNPPVSIVAKSGGEIDKLYVSEGSTVGEDDVIALISNTCNYDDEKRLKRFISVFDDKTDWAVIVRMQQSPPDLSLGEIQSEYVSFQKVWKEMKDYLDQAYIPSKLSLLEEQITRKKEYNDELVRQKELLTEDLLLTRNSFERDSILFHRQSYSISVNEFEKSRQAYIQKQYSYSVFNASLKNNEAEFLRLNETRLDLEIQYEKELKQYIFAIEESLQLLRSSISQWEEKYLIRSPVEGKVTFNRTRYENQSIKVGETFAVVIPGNASEVIARAVIPVSGFGKVNTGQSVNIKLSGFPYMQYGVLKGRIYSVSQVPGEEGFIAEIELTGGMTSTYREKIRFIHEMSGTADIITGNSRLLYRFIKPIRSIISE